MIERISVESWKKIGLAITAVLIFLSLFMWNKYHMNELLIAPALVLLVLQLLIDYRVLYYAMFLLIPASINIGIGSASVDTSEPLMLLMLVLFILNVMAGKQFEKGTPIRPLYVLIALLIFWLIVTTITSEFPLRSLKYLLAKTWYLAAFVFMADKVITHPKTIRIIFWCYLIPLVIFSLYTTYKHSLEGFTFEACNAVPYPYFTNHVIYGATLVLFLPYVWYAQKWYAAGSFPLILIRIALAIILLGVFLTYGRLAWLCALVLPFIYLSIKWKIMDKIVYAGLFVAFLGVSYLVTNNNYYKFAPDYARTVFHEGDIEGHLSATFEGTDVSGVERFYRWVGAKNMVGARPVLGFGASSFNQVYKNYADAAFRTYVSDNDEKSTTHNYYLMTCAEQGFIGLFLFLLLCIYMLIMGYKTYHLCQNPEYKNLVLIATLSLAVILIQICLNELIEVDKIGGMFWLALVIIQKVNIWEKEGIATKV